MKFADKILKARKIARRPRENSFVADSSIGELLKKQVSKRANAVYLSWFNKDNNVEKLTYRQFYEHVLIRAGMLLEQGIRIGDRVATISGNYPETVIGYFACWFIGATVVPLNAKEDPHRLIYTLVNANVKVILTRSEMVKKVRNLIAKEESLSNVTILPEPINVASLNMSSLEEHCKHVNHDSESLIVYTSGTTGNPKGVVLDHYNLLCDAQALADWHGVDEHTKMMCVLPIHHVNGTIVTLLTPMYAGASVLLNEKFSTSNFFSIISQEKINIVSVVPTLLAFLLESNISIEDSPINSLRHIICGAGPLTVDLAMKFENTYNIPIAHGYGLSETTCYSCCLSNTLSTEERRRWFSEYGYPSIGQAFPINEMAIHDTNGKAVGENQRGEIVIRGHNVMKGYYLNDKANKDAFKFGWFRSGDEGFWIADDSGEPHYFITGRIKELIIRGGVNISPFEIDEVLMGIQGVKAGISVGFEHDLYGEEVGAYVQLMEGSKLTTDQIIDACKKVLPAFKCPKVVLFGNEMPVTSTGKYQRNKLKPLFAEFKKTRF